MELLNVTLVRNVEVMLGQTLNPYVQNNVILCNTILRFFLLLLNLIHLFSIRVIMTILKPQFHFTSFLIFNVRHTNTTTEQYVIFKCIYI
jgi:hypothetical protein